MKVIEERINQLLLPVEIKQRNGTAARLPQPSRNANEGIHRVRLAYSQRLEF